MTKRIKIRLAEPDDEIYSNGLIVGGTPLASSRKNPVPPTFMEQESKEAEQTSSEIPIGDT